MNTISGEVVIGVHTSGVQVLRLILYSSEGRVMSEAQVAFVQRVPAQIGELGRLAGELP